MQKELKHIILYLPAPLAEYIRNLPESMQNSITEIRLRSARPPIISFGKNFKAAECGNTTNEDINSAMSLLSDYSLNSIRDKLCRGFIPLQYGCRAGIAGQIVLKNDKLYFQKDISGISFRIAREKKGCADRIIHDIINADKDFTLIYNTLIISPPGMGKTTLLRDAARQLGNICNVTIIDERSEIASVFNSIPQFDIGMRTDVIDACTKPLGIEMAIRSLSPNVIVTDEIGNIDDAQALMDCSGAGVSFIATMHAKNLDDLSARSFAKPLLENNIVKRIIIIGNSCGVGTVESVIRME